MVTIIFESHATSLDNEKGLASGLDDVELSELGQQQAKELGERYKNEHFDAIFCSNLKRSYNTAEIAFKNRDFKIIKDKRLRECDYGDLEHHPNEEVNKVRSKYINQPFPIGESYQECMERMKSFFDDLNKDYQDKKIMIIGHRVTQYGLEHWIKGYSLEKVLTDPWQWQPGWEYVLE
ncbi:histidine phosphatase family protein [Patescibacteria group bacterium]|nr:histidine phosphatase family protein [Patescibacteria group bacterium]